MQGGDVWVRVSESVGVYGSACGNVGVRVYDKCVGPCVLPIGSGRRVRQRPVPCVPVAAGTGAGESGSVSAVRVCAALVCTAPMC